MSHWIFNITIFAVISAAAAILLIPKISGILAGKSKRKESDAMLGAFVVLAILIGYFLTARTAIVMLVVCAWLCVVKYRSRRFGILAAFPVIIVTAVLIFFFKSGSSNGRLLIYRVIAEGISKPDFPFWSGVGRFEAWYNLAQAGYFAERNLNSNEALLADSTFFAFNDYMQFFIENGFPGFLLMMLVLLIYFRAAIIYFLSNEGNLYLTGAHLCLVSLLVAALFYYPFRIAAVYPLVFISIGILIMNSQYVRRLPVVLFRTVVSGYISLCFCVSIIYVVKQSGKEIRKQEAKGLFEAGFLHKAAVSYSSMIADGVIDADILYNSASVCLAIRNYDEVKVLLQRAQQYRSSDKLSALTGEYYQMIGDTDSAEIAYLEAVCINPKSFGNRLRLFNFYLDNRQFEKAKNWGYQTLQLKQKVPSAATQAIRNQIRNKLYQIPV